MATGQAGKGIGNQGSRGRQNVGTTDPDILHQDEMANQMQGNNQLHGNDQVQVHNERHAVAEESARTEGVVESFERMDPKARAGRKR